MATARDEILKFDETGNNDLVHREFDRNMKDFLLGRLISAKDFVMLVRPDVGYQRIERWDNKDSIYFRNMNTFNRNVCYYCVKCDDAIPDEQSRKQKRSANFMARECFACGISGNEIKDCPRKRQRHKPAFISSTSERARQSGQLTQCDDRKRPESDAEQFKDYVGATGVIRADSDGGFDPEVYRP